MDSCSVVRSKYILEVPGQIPYERYSPEAVIDAMVERNVAKSFHAVREFSPKLVLLTREPALPVTSPDLLLPLPYQDYAVVTAVDDSQGPSMTLSLSEETGKTTTASVSPVMDYTPPDSQENRPNVLRQWDAPSSDAVGMQEEELQSMDGPESVLQTLMDSLDAAERTIFDNLMESVTTVVMHDLIRDEMNTSHRPMEPTPEFLESLQNTGEDLFCNPWEYMLHSPDTCPNCGQMISLSKMAPHIVSSCKSGKGRRRRKASPPQRQTRSGASCMDPLVLDPHQREDLNGKRPADDYPTTSLAQVKRFDNGT